MPRRIWGAANFIVQFLGLLPIIYSLAALVVPIVSTGLAIWLQWIKWAPEVTIGLLSFGWILSLGIVFFVVLAYRDRWRATLLRGIKGSSSVDNMLHSAWAEKASSEAACQKAMGELLTNLLEVCSVSVRGRHKKAAFLERTRQGWELWASVRHAAASRSQVRKMPRNRGLAAVAIRLGASISIRDVQRDTEGLDYFKLGSAGARHRGIAAAPIQVITPEAQHYIGALCIAFEKPHRLSEFNRDVLQAYADKAGEVCIRVRELYGKCERHSVASHK